MSVYKIYCKNPDITDCYVGSSKNVINRIKQHKYSKDSNFKLYNFIREHKGMDNWAFIILEDNIDYNILHDREKYWIKHLNATLNTQWKNTHLDIFRCEFCNNDYKTISSINNHKKTSKKCLTLRNAIDTAEFYECKDCEFKTTLKDTIKDHKCKKKDKNIICKLELELKCLKEKHSKLEDENKQNIEKLNIAVQKIEKLKNKNILLKTELTEKLDKHETQLFTLASQNQYFENNFSF